MTRSGLKKIAVVLSFTSIGLLSGCHKAATVAKAAPAAPPPPAPTVSLTVSPAAIARGQSSRLAWHTDNATEVTISGLGTVSASARITVSVPAPVVARSAEAKITEEELFSRNVHDVFFDYDKHNIRSDQMQPLESDASFLEQHGDINVLIEGHCDERGTEEYNLGLGDQRANAVKDSLVRLGVPSSRIDTVSYGKERPFCTDENENCWQKNRRGHFVFERTKTSANR
jgi:peptidoglycan-associated lipoprotein